MQRVEGYDPDLALEVAATRRQQWRNILVFFAILLAFAGAVWGATTLYVAAKVRGGVACARAAAEKPPWRVDRCLAARGEVGALGWVPWARSQVRAGDQRIVSAVASGFAKVVPARAVSPEMARAAEEAYLLGVDRGYDFYDAIAALGLALDRVVAEGPSRHAAPSDAILRARLRLGDVAGAAAVARLLPAGDAALETRRKLVVCAAGGPDCAAPPRTLAGTYALPETPEGLWDGSFAALDPEPRSPQPTAEDELVRALGAAQVGRLAEARGAIAIARLMNPAEPRIATVETLLRGAQGVLTGKPGAPAPPSRLAPEALAQAAAELRAAGLTHTRAVLADLAARGASPDDQALVVEVAFADARSFRERIGVYILLERLARERGDALEAQAWEKRRTRLSELYRGRARALFDAATF